MGNAKTLTNVTLVDNEWSPPGPSYDDVIPCGCS